MVFQDGTNLNNVSKYIVDANGDTPYTTIQSALDAANTAGVAATVIIRPGIYTENLTLYDPISLVGSELIHTQIQGTHTPPPSGSLFIENLTFVSATDIFNSAVGGTTEININECIFAINNGYALNLLNWLGRINLSDITRDGNGDDGFINNTGGSPVTIYNCEVGNGNANSMILSGITSIDGGVVECPVTMPSTGTFEITNSSFDETIMTDNSAAVTITNSSFSTGANAAIFHGSANVLTLSDVSIDSSNAAPIGGTGTINFGSVTFLDESAIVGPITQTLTSILKTGEIHAENIQDQTFTGFLEFTGIGSIYTVAGTTFTLDRPGTGYIKGKKVSWLGAQNTGALAAEDTYFISIDDTGTLQTATSRSNGLYADEIVLFEMLVDVSSNVIVVRDNHPYSFPVESSNWAHDVVGTVIANKNNGANITLNGTKAIEIDTADELEDHGLVVTIPDSGGVAETFSFMFTNGAGKWNRDSQVNTFPSEYNNGGVVAALGNNKYGIFRLFISKDDIEIATPTYYAIFDTSQYNNLGQAQTAVANNSPANTSNELLDLEMAQLGFVIKEESSDNIVDVIIEKSVAGTQTSMPSTNLASLVTTNTTNFDGWLSATDTTVQTALDTLDEVQKGTTFSGTINVTSVDTNVAAAAVTLTATTLAADGTDGNIDISITPKGTGVLLTSAIGNAADITAISITAAGEITKPLQPAFLAFNTVSDIDVTGAGAVYTVLFNNPVFDQTSDYVAGTGIFSAPITAKYSFDTEVVIGAITGANNVTIRFNTSNRDTQMGTLSPSATKNAADQE